MSDPIMRQFQELSMQRTFTFATREAGPPTWGQLKKLTQEAEKTLQKAGQPLNPTNLLLAMMAVVTCQVMYVEAANYTYWAYIPNPPLVQAVSWGEVEVQVCTNETNFFPPPDCGGIEQLSQHVQNYNVTNLTIAAEGIPLCIGGHSFCLSTKTHSHHSYNTWGVNYRGQHFAVFTVLISSRGFNTSWSYLNKSKRIHMSLCPASFFEASLSRLEWEHCRDHNPRLVMNFSNHVIVDWSPTHGEFLEKWSNLSLKWHRINGTLNGQGNETVRWQHFALVPPQLQMDGHPQVQGDIWKLWAVSGDLTIWTGNFTLNINDPKGPFQVHLHINKSYSAIACVKFPYSLLYGQWIWNEILGVISCSDCNLTQCINRSWWENVENKMVHSSNYSLVIVKARTELWLPVNLTRPWWDSFAVTHLVNAVQTLLHRSRRMLGIVIASILTVASVTATATVAGLALHQGIQTADFVREWHKDAHLLWQQQHDLDAQLATDVLNLQHTVSWLGDQVTVLATKSVLKCGWNSSHLCVTPVPFNMSEGWEKMKRSLVGHQNLTAEIMELEQTMLSSFSKMLPDILGSDILKSLQEGLDNLNPLGHISTLLTTSFVNTLLIVASCFIAFIVYRHWRKGKQLKEEALRIQALIQHLQEKKGGDVGNKV